MESPGKVTFEKSLSLVYEAGQEYGHALGSFHAINNQLNNQLNGN
jgi:hypothetical protein